MIKRCISILLAVVTVLSMTSCSIGKSGGKEQITLTIMGKKTDLAKSYMTDIFERYEKETGNKLDIVAYEDADYEAEAAARFAKGDVPDVFLHFHNADLNDFDVANNFYYLNNEAWVSDLTDSAREYCEDRDGNLLGLPFWESSVSGCYYNKTILDSLGLKPATKQAEFDVLCQALADAGYTPICWPGNGCSWMIQFGLDPVFADDPQILEKINKNEITYADIPEVTDMVQWVSDAAAKGWFGDDYMNTGWSEISPVLSSGEAVMTFIWDTWFYTDFEAENQYTVDDFALMPVFMNTVDGGTYEGGNLNMMMVNKNGAQVEAALDFLSFCATPENYNAAFDGISTVSCFKGQTTNIQSPMVTDAGDSIAANCRVSTAASRVIGYSADEVAAIFKDMFLGRVDAAGCVKRMDESRIATAGREGVDGF